MTRTSEGHDRGMPDGHTVPEDPDWPRASSLLGETTAKLPPGTGAPRLVLVGAPLQASISPSQAHRTPHAAREELRRYSTFDARTSTSLETLDWVDLGDVAINQSDETEAARELREGLEYRLDHHLVIGADLLVVLGGDNAVTRPVVNSLPLALDRVGVITLDAHHDVRTFYAGPTNGTPIRGLLSDGLPGTQVVQVGIGDFTNSAFYRTWADEHGVTVFSVADVFEAGAEHVASKALAALPDSVEAIYVDVDVDVLDVAFAPACPGARPGGLLPFQLCELVRAVTADRRTAALDIVEVDVAADVRESTVRMMAGIVLTAAASFASRARQPA